MTFRGSQHHWSRIISLFLLAFCVLMCADALSAADRRLDSSTSAGTSASVQAAGRLALLIGNAGYDEAPLSNPLNDVRAFADALRSIGFEVIVRENATHKQMDEAVVDFWNRLKGKNVGLFYYSGHGLQVNGENYLVPIHANIKTEIDLRHECFAAQKILDYMQDAKPGLSLIILDACRNNPFRRGMRSVSRGLAPMNAGKQVLLAYATDPNNVAQDGDPQGNSPYMKHMLRHLQKPGLAIEQFFKEVRKGVLVDTNGEQTPWESSNLTDDFAFVPGGAEQPGNRTLPGSSDQNSGSRPTGTPLEIWTAEAEKGNVDAMYIVAYNYESGSMDFPVDKTQAFNWYKRAAEAGSADAMKQLSECFAEGKGCDRNPELARQWLKKAAAAGSASARAEQTEREQKLADLRQRSEAGNLFARFELWKLENDVSDNPAVQENLLLPAAEKGDVKTIELLGLLYLRELDIGSPDNRRKWLSRLAEKGDANTLFLIAKQFQTGIGLPRDFERAAALYRQARDLGHPNAAQELQELYDAGQADPQEDTKLTQTLESLLKKAEAGDAKAQLDVAIKLAKGEGTAIDMPKAVAWIKKSAAQKYPRAMTNLGQMYLGGLEEVKEDAAEGVRLLLQAAEAGDAEAAVTLLKWHQSRKPGAAGEVEALAWAYVLVKRSESLGELAWAYRDAGNFHIEKLTGSLSQAQIQKARQRMNELLKTVKGFKSF